MERIYNTGCGNYESEIAEQEKKKILTRSARPSRTAAITTAQAPVPQARVAPTFKIIG